MNAAAPVTNGQGQGTQQGTSTQVPVTSLPLTGAAANTNVAVPVVTQAVVASNAPPAVRPRSKYPIFCYKNHDKSVPCKMFLAVKLREAAPHLYPPSRTDTTGGQASTKSERGVARHEQYLNPHYFAKGERVPSAVRSLMRSNMERRSRGLMQGKEWYVTLGQALASYRTDGKAMHCRNPKVGALKTLRPSQVITDDEGYVIDHLLLERIELRALDVTKALHDEVRGRIYGWNYLVLWSGMGRGGHGSRNACVSGPNGALMRAAKKLSDEFPILNRCTDNFKAILIIFWAGYQVYWTK